jgi:hypothetical protein
MSAQEFGEWKAMFTAEELHPAADRLRHAQLIAAVHTGEIHRKDKRPWTAADFMDSDPWAVREPAAQPSIEAQVASINKLLD